MAKITINKITGKLIEYQSGKPPDNILIRNAVNAGYAEADVEVVEIQDSALENYLPIPTPEEIDAQKEAYLNQPRNKAIIEVVENLITAVEEEFPRTRGTLRARMGASIRDLVKGKL